MNLPRASCADVGIDPGAVLRWLDALESASNDSRSAMVVRNGKVAVEGWWAPFKAHEPHLLYSLSKSFTSIAAGIAIGEGHFTLDDQLADYFPDKLPQKPSPHLLNMTVRDALTMTTGHDTEPLCRLHCEPGDDWAKNFLHHPVEHEPGTHFLYNSPATYMVSALVSRSTSERLTNYLKPRLYEPLGIDDHHWDQCPAGVDVGGWGLSVTTESIAKFGLLLLQDGMWEGRRLVPQGWVAQATSKQVPNGTEPDNDWTAGYGFQFWICKKHNAYRADGAYGQLCVVIPEQDTVVAMTNCTDDIGRVLNTIWDVLVPGFDQPATASEESLRARLATLTTSPRTTSEVPADYRYEADGASLTITGGKLEFGFGDLVVVATGDRWTDQALVREGYSFPGSARYSLEGEVLTLKILDRGTPFHLVATLPVGSKHLDGQVEVRGVFVPGEPRPVNLVRV